MRRQITQGWIIFVASTLLVACSGEKSATEYLASANSHLESGELRAAIIETRNAVRQAPESPVARSLLGQLELQLGNPAGAEAELLKAIELGVPEPDLAADLSQVYLLLGKLDELRAMDSSLISDAHKARLLGHQSLAALVQGEVMEARQLATDALKADPVSAVALIVSARLQMMDNNVPAARTSLSTALDNTPGYSAGWELLGDIETIEKRYPEALSAYTRAVQANSNMFAPLFKRVRTHLALQDLESASADIAIFEERNIDLPTVNMLKGEILLREGKLADAQFALEESVKDENDFQPGIRALAITHMLRGNLEQAEQYGKRYFNSTDSDDSRILLATIRLQADRLEQAEQTLLPLSESGRLNVLGSQVLATTQLKQDKIDDAVNTMLGLHQNLLNAGRTGAAPPLAMATDPATTMSRTMLGLKADSVDNPDAPPYLSSRDVLVVDTVKALTEKNMSKALESANSLLDMQPDSADIHTLIGRIHFGKDDSAAASDAFKKAMALDENPGTALILASMLEMNSGDSLLAKNMLEEAFNRATGPTRERILLGLATIEVNSGNEERAFARLKQAQSENPASYQPSLLIAGYYANVKDPENVLNSLSELSTTSLQNPSVIELRTQALIALEQFDEAIELLTPQIQSEPDTAQWRYLRAKASAGKNDMDAVKRDLDVALRLDPKHTPSALARANVSILTNELQQAEIQLARLETLVPGSEALTMLSNRMATARQRDAQPKVAQGSDEPPANTLQAIEAARTFWANGDQDGAIATLTDWLDANPQDTTARLTLANIYMTLGRSADATVTYQAVISDEEENYIALNNLAWQIRNDDPKAAIGFAKRAVEQQPENTAALDTLAVIQFEQGMFSEAGETFQLIRGLQPTDPTILYHGARIQAALGEKQDARQILAPIVNGNIDFPDAKAARKLFDEL